MNNRSIPDSRFHSMRDWRQQGNGGAFPAASSESAPGQQEPMPASTIEGAPGQQGPAGQEYHYQYNSPNHIQHASGQYQQGTPAQPQPGSGTYQQYPSTPPAGQYYAGAPGQQAYGSAPDQSSYRGAPGQGYGGPVQGQPNYFNGSAQPQNPQGQPPFASGNYQRGNYQQYGPVPTPATGSPVPPYSSVPPQFASGQQYGPPAAPASFYPAPANNPPYQGYGQGGPGGPYQPGPGPQKRGPGWKVLFFIVPVVLVVFASIFGPNVVRNMAANKQPLAGMHLGKQVAEVPTPTQQQVQSIQQYDEQMRYKQLARLYVSQMSLDEEIGQLMVVTYNTNDYSQDLDYMLNQQHVGGVIMYQLSFEQQLQSAAQVQADVAKMQQRATFPLFIAIDEEGWNVDRLGEVYPVPPNPKRLAADDIHQTGNPAVATSEGQRVAHDMMALGINVNFAPDVDVATYHGYIDWDYRAFGTNPDDVIKYAGPYLEAMQAGGVIGTLKHFVGLGAVPHGNANDPHFVLPSVDLTPDQINTHLSTFKHFIQSPNKLDHPGFIMPTDLMVPSIDPKYPTEFSHTFITDMLRNQLGYDGVVITDGLQMGGVQLNGQTLTEAYASVLALQAGCDMVLDIAGSEQVAAVSDAIKAALQNGTLTKARIDESVTRIITLKMERGVVPSIPGESLTA